MSQITHQRDPDTGYMVQIVTPTELRRILHRDGDNLERPKDFGPCDEWDVDAEQPHDGSAFASCELDD